MSKIKSIRKTTISNRIECSASGCKYHERCKSRMGKLCKHHGGKKIPSFRVIYREEDIA